MDPQARKGVWLTLLGALWGAAYLVPYKAASVRAGAEGLVLPMLFAAAVLNTLPLGHARWRRPWRLDRTALVVAALLGVASALGNEAMARALRFIDPGIAAVALRTQVLWVALMGWWILHERINLRFWLGTLLALAGFALLQLGAGSSGVVSVAGVLWALVAALAFASMQVVVRRTIRRIDPVVVNSLRLWFAVVLVACVPGRIGHLAEADGEIWLLAGAAALFGPVISRICMMLALRYITAALSTLIMFAGPVFAFVLGGFFFHWWPGPLQIAGCLIVLAGIALPVLHPDRARGAP